jgi:hypothetical protein
MMGSPYWLGFWHGIIFVILPSLLVLALMLREPRRKG